MGAKGDLLLLIFIIGAFGVMWAFTGGPERARENQGVFLKPPSPLDSGEVYGKLNLSKSSVGIDLEGQGGDNKEDAVNREAVKVISTFNKVEEELKDVEASGDFSQFKNKITIRKNTAGPKKDSALKEYVTLSASRNNTENISITGWKLESMITQKKIKIGGATEVYISGVVNQQPALKLAPGETAVIATGRSPIGASFKINKCTGYFEQFQDFSPKLSKKCPDPNAEFDKIATSIPINDLVCEDFIDRINRCEMPLSSYPIGTSNKCSEFISANINYTGCVKNHRNDLDFIGKEWRVFLGRNEEFWREKREVIRLLDDKGKVVDTFTY